MGDRLSPKWWAKGRLALMALALAALSTFLLSFPLFASGQLALDEGDVAPRDVRAPRDISYDSAILTAEQERLAEEGVDPVFTAPDSDLARQQLEQTARVLDYLVSVRADSLATPSQQRAWVLAVPELADLPLAVVDQLLALSDESWSRVQLETQKVVGEAMQQGVRESSIAETRERVVPSLVGLDLSAEEAAVTAAQAQRLLVVNSFYDEEATQAARDRARENVSPVLRAYDAGEIIVREGQKLTALHVEALRELGLQRSRTRWVDVIGSGALAGSGVVLLGLFLSRFRPGVLWEGRKLLLLVLLLSVFFVLARLMIPGRAMLQYLFPGPALAMLTTATLGPHVGLAVSVLMGSAVGLISDRSLELATYVMAGGLLATLTLRRVDRLGVLFRAALFVSAVHVAVVVGFRLPVQRQDLVETGLGLLVATANGVVSASMALGGLFLIGPLFDVITTFRLFELSRPDHPLLQRLLRETPGTYHHSLLVGNLAEQAAERIGADAFLTRVGAYYHDAGKIARPYFFAENQMEGVNPHERLDPYTSAEIIVGHVRDGLELARRYRLPARVRAFIPEHHGTNRAGFQYERALELAGDSELVDEADFHHKGPRPRSKETALVMLADSCEATVRAHPPATAEELGDLVDQVFDRVMRAGQLDECPITMRELSIVRESFASALKGVFHPRIKYPQPGMAADEHGADASVSG